MDQVKSTFTHFYHEFAYLSRVVLSLMTMDNRDGKALKGI